MVGLAGSLDPIDFGLAHSEHLEAGPACRQHDAGRGGGSAPQGGQIFELGGIQLLGEHCSKRLSGPHVLACGPHIKLFKPSRHSRVDFNDARFVDHSSSDAGNGFFKFPDLCSLELDAKHF